jgi:hypothetical protein
MASCLDLAVFGNSPPQGSVAISDLCGDADGQSYRRLSNSVNRHQAQPSARSRLYAALIKARWVRA